MKLNIQKLEDGNKIPTFGLPEVTVYPDNKWGDIARNQGLETARNWRRVRNATTEGINNFGTATASALKEISSYTPIGDIQDVSDVITNLHNKDYIGASLAGIGFLPFIGNPLRKIIDYRNLKKFVDKYNYTYPKVSPELIFSDKLDKYVEHFADRHNTFVRGTTKPELANVAPDVTQGASNLKNWESGIYTSNSFDTARGYAGSDGKVVLLRRPYEKGKTLSETLKNADNFELSLEPNPQTKRSNIFTKALYNVPVIPQYSDYLDGKKFTEIFNEIEHKYDVSNRNELYKAMQEAKAIMNERHHTNIPINNEIRLGMVGAKRTTKPYYRHYIFVTEPNTEANLDILEILPSYGGHSKASDGYTSMQLSRKFQKGGVTPFK